MNAIGPEREPLHQPPVWYRARLILTV